MWLKLIFFVTDMFCVNLKCSKCHTWARRMPLSLSLSLSPSLEYADIYIVYSHLFGRPRCATVCYFNEHWIFIPKDKMETKICDGMRTAGIWSIFNCLLNGRFRPLLLLFIQNIIRIDDLNIILFRVFNTKYFWYFIFEKFHWNGIVRMTPNLTNRERRLWNPIRIYFHEWHMIMNDKSATVNEAFLI